MQQDQMGAYTEHIANGGKKASLFAPVIISVAVVSIVCGFMIWGKFYLINIPEQKIEVNGDYLYYTKTVKYEEAKKLCDYLEQNEIFIDDTVTFTTKIDKKTTNYIFLVIIKDEYMNNKETIDYFTLLAQQLSTDLYSEKVEVAFCNNRFKPIKTISY